VGSLVSQARSLLSCAGARAESRQWAEKPPLSSNGEASNVS
jgi:hypothetical protein